MDWWLASFFLGAILSLFSPIVPDLFTLFLLLLASISFLWLKPTRLSSGLLFGMLWLLFNAYSFEQLWQKNNLDAISLASKAQWVQGKVLSLQTWGDQIASKVSQGNSTEKRLRFSFRVSHINNQTLVTPILLRLSWKNPDFTVLQGQNVSLKVKFKPAHGLANLGGFSYQTWLNSNKISATGYVINNKANRISNPKATVRQALFSQYQQLLPQEPIAPLLLALGFGSRSELSQELWHVLQATGTGHLIAISGLHIGLVATGSYFFIMLIIRALPLRLFCKSNRFQVINVRYVAIALSVLIALSYGYLAGFSLPTVRALLMLNIYWCTRLLAIKLSVSRWFLITLFLLVLTTPFSLFTASFWLSVYAVSIIFLSLWRFRNFIGKGEPLWCFVKGLVVIQLSLTLMLLPISAIFFHQISLIALLANIIAVPWMSFISIPLCLLSVLVMPISEMLSQYFIFFSLQSLQLIWHYLSYLAAQPFAIMTLSSVDIKWLIAASIISVYFLFFQHKVTINNKQKILISGSLVLLLGSASFSSITTQEQLSSTDEPVHSNSDWQLAIFDVGQGLSVLIEKQGKAILYDTGASYPSGFNMIDAVVSPYLQHVGIKALDKVIISHSDNDHAGGLAQLQELIGIKEVIDNSNQNINTGHCLQGKVMNWQGLKVEMLWPEQVVGKENDDSCVLLISDGRYKVLFTGDISSKVEAKLLAKYPQLTIDVLVVPHHGSKTSSSKVFIEQLSPQIAVVSAGYLNRWKMPVEEVVERYHFNGVKLVNTAKLGQININFSTQGVNINSYRDDLWPFWFAKSMH